MQSKNTKIIQSPLNYTGGKGKLLNQILPLFPNKINTFVDLFCGGCNVGLNVNADKVYYNDNNKYVIGLFNTLKTLNPNSILELIYENISKYHLSLVSIHGYEYYNCNSSDGVGKYNKDKYLKLRSDYNKMEMSDVTYIILYVLIVYAFNNQIRFNSKGEFNLPVGKRDFNSNMEEKLNIFIKRIKEQDCTFSNKDFRNFNINKLGKNDLIYVDPPYLITCATYNENGGWTANDEKDLLFFLDNLNDKNIRFALSNVIKNKGKTNKILEGWLERHKKYRISHLSYNYANSNYHTKEKNKLCDEVLITNY